MPDINAALEFLRSRSYYGKQLQSHFDSPSRIEREMDVLQDLPVPILEILNKKKMEKLYSHQYQAVEKVASENIVITTGTSSGKSLCYWLPILTAILKDPRVCALVLFPTKALARDQLRHLEAFIGESPELLSTARAGVYDGDTASGKKAAIRKECNIILTNPDSLHHSILPVNGKWLRFLSSLKFVVLDEAHLYRGVFGTQVALVLRRLRRVNTQMQGKLRWICSSATIGNAKEFVETLVGEPFFEISEDGSPSGQKIFAVWDPHYANMSLDKVPNRREQVQLLIRDLMEHGLRLIVFTQTRLQCEILGRQLRKSMRDQDHNQVALYRAGFTPEERKKIEAQLFSGELKTIISTSALEVGIDVGELDAAIIVGFPRSLSSFKQQSGRAGRGLRSGLTLFIPASHPIDQYLRRHPNFLFQQPAESAYCDPNNPYLLSAHLKCAAREIPLSQTDAHFFGPNFLPAVEQLQKTRKLKEIKSKWYLPHTESGSGIGLRSLSEKNYDLVVMEDSIPKVVGQIDDSYFQRQIFPNAIYLLNGTVYQVAAILEELQQVYLEASNAEFFTVPQISSDIFWRETLQEKSRGTGVLMQSHVTQQAVVGRLKKVHIESGRALGWVPVERSLPRLDSSAILFSPSEKQWEALKRQDLNPFEGLVGLQNIFQETLPISALCDKNDFQVNMETQTHRGISVLDIFPGGVGLSQKVFVQAKQIVELAYDVILHCSCTSGCPSCVGFDPLEAQPGKNIFPNKQSAKILLEGFLGSE